MTYNSHRWWSVTVVVMVMRFFIGWPPGRSCSYRAYNIRKSTGSSVLLIMRTGTILILTSLIRFRMEMSVGMLWEGERWEGLCGQLY